MTPEVIPATFYRDPVTGRTFSPYSSWMPEGCVLVTSGYTIRWPDGTSGAGTRPFATIAEAQAFIAKVPIGFKGMSTLGN